MNSLFVEDLVLAAKSCAANCDLFKCGKNAAVYRGDGVWCRWTEDDCEIAHCSFATCVKRRLLPEGVCGESVRRKTTETDPEQSVIPSVRLKGKALRKLGEREIF